MSRKTEDILKEYYEEQGRFQKEMKERQDLWWLSKKEKEGTITEEERCRLQEIIRAKEERLARRTLAKKECKGYKVITHYTFEESIKPFDTIEDARAYVKKEVGEDKEKERSYEIVKCIEEVDWEEKQG